VRNTGRSPLSVVDVLRISDPAEVGLKVVPLEAGETRCVSQVVTVEKITGVSGRTA